MSLTFLLMKIRVKNRKFKVNVEAFEVKFPQSRSMKI